MPKDYIDHNCLHKTAKEVWDYLEDLFEGNIV